MFVVCICAKRFCVCVSVGSPSCGVWPGKRKGVVRRDSSPLKKKRTHNTPHTPAATPFDHAMCGNGNMTCICLPLSVATQSSQTQTHTQTKANDHQSQINMPS
jgi:hypothetical protein